MESLRRYDLPALEFERCAQSGKDRRGPCHYIGKRVREERVRAEDAHRKSIERHQIIDPIRHSPSRFPTERRIALNLAPHNHDISRQQIIEDNFVDRSNERGDTMGSGGLRYRIRCLTHLAATVLAHDIHVHDFTIRDNPPLGSNFS